jgi:tetratricopeptide (TPR) repeat protein
MAGKLTGGWLLTLALVAGASGLGAQTQTADPLIQARTAYNAGEFDQAIAAATNALRVPQLANAGAVVLARAHLDRYRVGAAREDLDAARNALRLVVPDALAPRDHVEFLVGLGLSLYLEGCPDGCYGGAAEIFAVALARADDMGDRERIFEWWAGALDRQAQFGPENERADVYRRILARAEAELARNDRSASAMYWLAASARGTGDLQRAWSLASAGWIRARSLGPRGEQLRADLDRLVTQALLPERARLQSPTDPPTALAPLLQHWEEIKKKYE